MTDIGASLRAAREVAGVSLAGLAARTHYSKSLLGHIETGERKAKAEHVMAYSRGLSVPMETLYGTPNDPLRLAHEWLVNDFPSHMHTSAGRRVGSSLASELEKRVVELRHLDDVVSSTDLLPVVRREFGAAQDLVDTASFTQETERRLFTVVGELAQLAGWIASDAGQYAEAEHAYLDGVTAVENSKDRTLSAQLFSSLSYQMANVGNPADASLLARTAVKGALGATPVVKTLLLERLAWASARSHDADTTRRILEEVDEMYERRSTGIAEPEWVYWLNRGEIDVMAGRCLIELSEPARAEPLLSNAIAGYQTEHVREVALYLSWLAESYARVGELDAAQDTLNRLAPLRRGSGQYVWMHAFSRSSFWRKTYISPRSNDSGSGGWHFLAVGHGGPQRLTGDVRVLSRATLVIPRRGEVLARRAEPDP